MLERFPPLTSARASCGLAYALRCGTESAASALLEIVHLRRTIHFEGALIPTQNFLFKIQVLVTDLQFL
jgi:hypothetical protein